MPTTAAANILREAWTSDATFATTLLCLFVDTYGTEGLNWDPETIRMEIQDDFNVTLPQANYDRLMAAISLIVTDDFYWSLPDFIQVCNVLSGDLYSEDEWDPADATEIAWGITEAVLIDPPDDEEPFSQDILAYIGAMLDQEGIIKPPDILRLALREDPSTKVHTEWSDDPEMFTSIYALEAQKTQEINEYVRHNIDRLAAQLDTLPLRVGSARDVVKQMLSALGQKV